MYIIAFFSNVLIIDIVLIKAVGQDSPVSIEAHYGMDGPWRFSTPVQTGPGPTQPPTLWVPGLS